MSIDSKRIAKNTFFLYVRLILVLGVTLYTSRVVLDKLGVDDYGLYNVVFGVIGLLSFLNGTLSFGTSRFITFELGKKNIDRLKITFSTALGTHFILASIIFILGETIGIWYIYNILVCPPGRFKIVFWVYQISIIQTIFSIIQVPFSSEIIAHEKMKVYAYIGIYEAVAKLLIVFLLINAPFDKLLYYAILVASVIFSILVINVVYCLRNFKESHISLKLDSQIFKSILCFSGWNIIANMSGTLMSQGVIMLLNLFFQPFVVAAQAISNQISSALMQFVNNVRQAINPQVIKLYAEGDYNESKRLTLISAEYVFYLLLLMGIPMIMIMPKLLDVWLVDVPSYAVEFARLVIIQDILGNFSAAFYTPMVAANKIKKNSLVALVLCIIQFSSIYILFKIGLSPLWARYVGIFFTIIWSFVVKPYILWKDIGYNWSELVNCIWRSVRVLIPIIALCGLLNFLIPQDSFIASVVVALLSFVFIAICTFILIDKHARKRLIKYIKSRLP